MAEMQRKCFGKRGVMSTILKCKMCGGDIEVNKDMTVGTCLYCGSIITLPRIDTDKKARMFNRANQYRMENEFDKAYRVYEAILEEDPEEAEAYWGLILSEYGVEYVVDPANGKRIPTCHRTQTKLIKASSNYENAINYADSESRFIYEDEATKIDNIQKKILTISYKEEPYDVFICYKESDAKGERTEDSVLAQNIYDELEQKGIKTFFARISLEDKLGKDYEPYIYSALKSARVMLLVTTCNEHCEAVWVRNEWSRYLRFMEEGDKTLIPVFKIMSPYELPDELAKFQAQDMGKVGAIQDLVRGVQKILGQTKTEKDNAALNELLAEKVKREEKQKKSRKIIKWAIIGTVTCALLVGTCVKFVVIPTQTYNEAVLEMQRGNFAEAVQYFDELDEDFKDTKELKNQAIYRAATKASAEGAIAYLERIPEYKDSKERLIDYHMDLVKFSDNDVDSAMKHLKSALQYAGDLKSFSEEWKTTLVKVNSLAERKYKVGNYGVAKQIYEVLSELDFKESSNYYIKIKERDDEAQSKYEEIYGTYLNKTTGVYLVLGKNNSVFLTEYEADLEKNTRLAGWSYCYTKEEGCFTIFSKSGKEYGMHLSNEELEIRRVRQSNASSTSFESLINGTYEKID